MQWDTGSFNVGPAYCYYILTYIKHVALVCRDAAVVHCKAAVCCMCFCVEFLRMAHLVSAGPLVETSAGSGTGLGGIVVGSCVLMPRSHFCDRAYDCRGKFKDRP